MKKWLFTLLSILVLTWTMTHLSYANNNTFEKEATSKPLLEWISYYQQNKDALETTGLNSDVGRRELAAWIMNNIGEFVIDYDDYKIQLISNWNKSVYETYGHYDGYSQSYQGKSLQEWKDYYKEDPSNFSYYSDLMVSDLNDDKKLTEYICNNRVVIDKDYNKGFSIEQWIQYYKNQKEKYWKTTSFHLDSGNADYGSDATRLTKTILKYHLINEEKETLTLDEWAHYYYYNIEASKSPWLSDIITINEYLDYILAHHHVSGYYFSGGGIDEMDTIERWTSFYYRIEPLRHKYSSLIYNGNSDFNQYILANNKINPAKENLTLDEWIHYYTNNRYKPIKLTGLPANVSKYDLSIYILTNHKVKDYRSVESFVKLENLKNDDGTKARTLKEWESYYIEHPTAFNDTGLPRKTSSIYDLDVYILNNKKVTDYNKYKFMLTGEYGSKFDSKPDFKVTKTIVPYRAYNLDLEYTNVNIVSYDKRDIVIKKIYINTKDHQGCLGATGKKMGYTSQFTCRADLGEVISVDIVTNIGRYEYTFR